MGAIRHPQQRQTRLRSLWTVLFSAVGKSWHMIPIHCQSSPSTTTNAMLSASSQTLPVITTDDCERDVVCQFIHFGSANNDNLSCSSKDSSVGKPRAVGEDKGWQSTMPVHCCLTAIYAKQDRIINISTNHLRSIRRILGRS